MKKPTAKTRATAHSRTVSSTATRTQVSNLDRLRTFLPAKSKESDAQLKNSLERYGQLSPIVRHRGKIVDGVRRERLLGALKITPRYFDLDLAPGAPAGRDSQADALGSSFFEINGCRREFNEGVRAAMADLLATMKKGDNQHTAAAAGGLSLAAAAQAMGTSEDSIGRWRAIKNDPKLAADVINGHVSLSQGARMLTGMKQAAAAAALVCHSADINLMLKEVISKNVRFGVVYADPPWNYGQGNRPPTGAANPKRHYPTMTLDAIKAMPVAEIAASDSVLYLWTPNCLMDDALEVMKAWGFTYVSSAVWIKNSAPPTKSPVRPYHETLLFGKRGAGVANDKRQMKSFYMEKVSVHSRKPAWFAKELERIYPAKNIAKVELFCRQARSGWVSLGNQAKPLVKRTRQPSNKAHITKSVAKRSTKQRPVGMRKTA
jgi:N6-adenosine-specific RNA methylase IME4